MTLFPTCAFLSRPERRKRHGDVIYLIEAEWRSDVSKLTNIGSDNGLSPDRRQAIILTNAGILLILNLGTNFSDFLSEIRAYSFIQNAFENVVRKMAAILSRPQCVIYGHTILIVYSTMCSGAYQRKHQSATGFCEGNSPKFP